MFERLRQANTDRTQGEWRWEVNEAHKSMRLVGGRSLIVLDSVRWGMCGAIIRLRDFGTDLMHRCTNWTQAVRGREHHASWCKTIEHPDAQFMTVCTSETEGVPELLRQLDAKDRLLAEAREGLRECAAWMESWGSDGPLPYTRALLDKLGE